VKARVKELLKMTVRLLDPLLAVMLAPAVLVLKAVRTVGLHKTPLVRKMLLAIGVLPVRDHYYEPQIRYDAGELNYDQPRDLPGIDWNMAGQLEMLASLDTRDELKQFAEPPGEEMRFYIKNELFGPGDADFWYQFVRYTKPNRIIEVGSGNSTLVAVAAAAANASEDPERACSISCIEPYEQPWLEQLDIEVIRTRVEEIDPDYFCSLAAGDVLFIDSSHVIRPAGDVLHEYLRILPRLQKGVYVHVHDIFSPRNYPQQWIESELRLWNEQYLLEAFLSNNPDWQVVAALNMLSREHYEAFARSSLFLQPGSEPRSFYMQKVN